jgi:hypothetical protein
VIEAKLVVYVIAEDDAAVDRVVAAFGETEPSSVVHSIEESRSVVEL